MANLTRRGLIRRAALGTAATGAVLMAPDRAFAQVNTGAEAVKTRPSVDRAPITANGPLGAYVHDVAAGEITLLFGTREVTLHDPELVRRLVQSTR